MIGIVFVILAMICKLELSTAFLAFIGLEIFGVNMQLNYFRMKDVRKNDAIGLFLEGLRKGLQDGRRDAEDSKRNQDRDGE